MHDTDAPFLVDVGTMTSSLCLLKPEKHLDIVDFQRMLLNHKPQEKGENNIGQASDMGWKAEKNLDR